MGKIKVRAKNSNLKHLTLTCCVLSTRNLNLQILVIFIFGALLSSTKGEIGRKDKPILDLDDYIDSGQGATQTVAVANTNTKREELRASETGYYGAHPQHGHAHHHHHSPHGYQHHGHVLYETHGKALTNTDSKKFWNIYFQIYLQIDVSKL